MKPYIAEANADLAVSPVRTNHGNRAKRVVLGCVKELENLSIPREKDVALLEVSLILNHTYNITQVAPKRKLFLQLFFQICVVTS